MQELMLIFVTRLTRPIKIEQRTDRQPVRSAMKSHSDSSAARAGTCGNGASDDRARSA